jgi:hypothetical protein
VAFAPPALLFAWNALDAGQTGSWLTDNWDTIPRAVLAALTVAAAYTTLALFAASFTTRRAYATIAMLAVLFIGSAIGGIAEDNFTVADARRSLPHVRLPHLIFGDPAGKPVAVYSASLRP